MEDERIAFLFALQEQHMQSICEVNTAAGPAYHTVYSVSFLAFIDASLRHMKYTSCHDTRMFVFKISISVILHLEPMEDSLSQYFFSVTFTSE